MMVMCSLPQEDLEKEDDDVATLSSRRVMSGRRAAGIGLLSCLRKQNSDQDPLVLYCQSCERCLRVHTTDDTIRAARVIWLRDRMVAFD